MFMVGSLLKGTCTLEVKHFPSGANCHPTRKYSALFIHGTPTNPTRLFLLQKTKKQNTPDSKKKKKSQVFYFFFCGSRYSFIVIYKIAIWNISEKEEPPAMSCQGPNVSMCSRSFLQGEWGYNHSQSTLGKRSGRVDLETLGS